MCHDIIKTIYVCTGISKLSEIMALSAETHNYMGNTNSKDKAVLRLMLSYCFEEILVRGVIGTDCIIVLALLSTIFSYS